MSRLAAPPLSLYVHLPWCVRKCPYCDFNSHARPTSGVPEDAYLAALLDDLDWAAAGAAGREVVSVFFGGGTPSLFRPASIGALLERVAARLPVAADVEVTLEANPGTVEHGAFAGYAAAGVNRVSLGAQSFDDACLAAIGRIHSAGETVAAVGELRDAGIANFNLDLMYGLPEQGVAQAVADLERAIALGPSHLSHYHLTLEPGTAFERRPPRLPDEDVMYAMQETCQARLAGAGYTQYEVSAYARDGARCRHNLNYWSHGDYLGIGAGAHGKLTDVAAGRIVRTERVRQPGLYMGAREPSARVSATRVVGRDEGAFEFFLNALRLVDGFTPGEFESRTGLAWTEVEPTVRDGVERGLLEPARDGGWRPTARGRLFLNDLQAMYLPEAPAGG
ncbi:MAG: radical SAM family heme chaperone HemW [Steroidobacteraceae bacterium]